MCVNYAVLQDINFTNLITRIPMTFLIPIEAIHSQNRLHVFVYCVVIITSELKDSITMKYAKDTRDPNHSIILAHAGRPVTRLDIFDLAEIYDVEQCTFKK